MTTLRVRPPDAAQPDRTADTPRTVRPRSGGRVRLEWPKTLVDATIRPTPHVIASARRSPPLNDPLAVISDNVDALCDASQLRSPRHRWDDNRNKKPLPDHVTTLPGLIQQLRDMAEPGAAESSGGVRSVPDSRPPVTLDAVSLLHSIEFGAAKRMLDLGLAIRNTAEGNLRALVGEAPRLPSDVQQLIALEVRSWRNQAEVICRWRTGAVDLRAPCPAMVLDPRTGGQRKCLARTVVANPDTYAAWCITCGAEWSPEEFDGLRAQLRKSRDRSQEAADRVREDVRAGKVAARETELAAREARNRGRDAA